MEIRQLQPGDAADLKECFISCYGDSYANDLFYDVAALTRAIEQGRLVSVVAVAGQEVLGHTGLTLAHAGAKAAEAGNTVVSPATRGQGLLGKLGAALADLTQAKGFCGYTHYPTTAHEIMQKRATSGTGRETGIMLAYIPAETDYADFDQAGGRLAATVVYQPFSDGPAAQIIVSARYAARIERFAAALNLDRTIMVGSEPVTAVSDIDVAVLDKRHLARVSVNTIGRDFVVSLPQLNPVSVVHVDLPMNDPAAGWAADQLMAQGFVYAGWLPYFAESDVLRMQRVPGLTDAEREPMLVTDEARVILGEILDELDLRSVS